MTKRLLDFCARLSFWKILAYGAILAVAIEAVTIVFRFGFDLRSTRDTAVIGAWTFGLRVHHGYIGLLLLPLAWCFPLGLRHALWIVALGLILSDLAHHFLVLWPLTGSPQCDLIYPQHPYWNQI